MEQIRHTLYDIVQEKVDTLESRFQKFDEFTHSVMGAVDKNAHELCSTVAKIIDEQADIRRLVEERARRMDHAQEGSVGADIQEGPGVAIQLEVNDLKVKVLRLTEQVTEHIAKVNFFSVMSEKVDLMDQQIHRWRYRVPDLTDDESQEPIVSAVEVQEELNRFKDLAMSKVREVRDDLHSLDREVQLLERARTDSWEVISQRLNTIVGDSVSALSDRLTDLEQTVQSRMTTPVTDASATHVPLEAITSIEQALMHELGRVKDENTKSILRQVDLMEPLNEKQKFLEN